MRLKYQLFITLVIAGTLLVALMSAFSSLSFSRGFLGYINNAESKRMQPLIEALEAEYSADPSWEKFTSNPHRWKDIIQSNAVEFQILRHKRRHPDGDQSRNRPPPPPSSHIERRLILAGKDKLPLIGQIRKKQSPTWKPITHENTVVGYLGLYSLRRLDKQLDQAFERRQKKAFALAGLSMVLLSGLLAAPLASRIVNPILSVKSTVAEISQGNFSHRINTKRRDEIGDLATDINRLGATLEQNKEARQRLVAEISHELRTPVAVLRGELEALQDGIREINSDSIDSLHAETIKLNRLIDDLHTLSVADAGGLDYLMEPVNLRDLVHKQIRTYQASEPELDIKVIAIEPIQYISGDKQRLEQLINNLMQNSIRYTDRPGLVTIHIDNDNANNAINLKWSDSSPGVSDAALDKLFEPLFRTEESRSREHGGSGLGLSIVRKIVHAHDGTCTASHSDTGGLAISISLPMLTGALS